MGVVVVQSFHYVDPSDIRFHLPPISNSAVHAETIMMSLVKDEWFTSAEFVSDLTILTVRESRVNNSATHSESVLMLPKSFTSSVSSSTYDLHILSTNKGSVLIDPQFVKMTMFKSEEFINGHESELFGIEVIEPVPLATSATPKSTRLDVIYSSGVFENIADPITLSSGIVLIKELTISASPETENYEA